MTKLGVGRDHRTVDLVVQQAKQDVGLANGADQCPMGNDPAIVRKNLHVSQRAQARDGAVRNRLRYKDAQFSGHRNHRTIPATPSTAHCAPSGILRVASSTPSTIGMPRSRASDAMCEVEPPRSATTPDTRGKMWLKAGPATRVT